jgi:hypothetical protein
VEARRREDPCPFPRTGRFGTPAREEGLWGWATFRRKECWPLLFPHSRRAKGSINRNAPLSGRCRKGGRPVPSTGSGIKECCHSGASPTSACMARARSRPENPVTRVPKSSCKWTLALRKGVFPLATKGRPYKPYKRGHRPCEFGKRLSLKPKLAALVSGHPMQSGHVQCPLAQSKRPPCVGSAVSRPGPAREGSHSRSGGVKERDSSSQVS